MGKTRKNQKDTKNTAKETRVKTEDIKETRA